MPETQAGIIRRSVRSTKAEGFGVGDSRGASFSLMAGVTGRAVCDVTSPLSSTLLHHLRWGIAGAEMGFYNAVLRSQASKLHTLAHSLLQRGMASRMVSGFMLVALMTVVGKGVSFVKDAAVAGQFGINDALDSYLFAFGLLASVAALLGGGIPESFLPLYAEIQHHRQPDDAQKLAVQSCVLQLLTLIVIATAMYFGAPQMVSALAAGFSPEKQTLTIEVLRRLLPFMVSLGLSYQLGVWLRAEKYFGVVSASPVVVPLAILAMLFFANPKANVETLVLGTVIGAGLHVLVLVITIGRQVHPLSAWSAACFCRWEVELGKVARNALPYLLASAIFGSTVVVDQIMAAWLTPGSVAVLGFTDKICGMILAVTASPSCEVLFPYVADQVARQDWVGVRRQLFSSALLIVALALPAVLVLIWLAPQIVSLLFQRGSFTAEDTQRVAEVLRFSALQIPFYILGSLAARVVVAMQAPRFIVIVSALATLGNGLLNWLLMQDMGLSGIALATAIVQLFSATAACTFVLKKIREQIQDQEASLKA
jgi:putative peptidoglycan lipid II flippase